MIVVKPILEHTNGMLNEKIILNQLRYHLETPKDIKFISNNYVIQLNEVTQANLMPLNAHSNHKTDLVLTRKDHFPFHISLKKDNAQQWESADTYFADQAQDLINNSKALLHDNGSYYRIDPNIATKATFDEQQHMVFGNDLDVNGAVMIRSFANADFQRIGNTLEINVSQIIQSQSDLKEDQQVYFLIRNDKSRRSIPNLPGLRCVAIFKKRLRKSTEIINRHFT